MGYSGPGQVLWGDRVVLEAENAQFALATGNNDVSTLAKGRAGHSRGAKKYTLRVDNAIPDTGFEVDWEGIADAQLEVAIGFRIGTTTWLLRGDIRDVDVSTDTNASNKVTFTFHGIKTGKITG